MSESKLKIDPLDGTHGVDVVSPAFPGERFHYWIPEAVKMNEGCFVLHLRDAGSVRWKTDESGVVSHSWRVEGMGQYVSKLAPKGNAVEISLTVSNNSRQCWRNVRAFPCLQLIEAPIFKDPEMTRTFVHVNGAFKPLSQTRPTGRDCRRTLLSLGEFSGDEITSQMKRTGWGYCLDQPDAGIICTTSKDGRWTIGTFWEEVGYLGNRATTTFCIYSQPNYGDIEPGETVERKGWIYLMEGTPEDLFDEYKLRTGGEHGA